MNVKRRVRNFIIKLGRKLEKEKYAEEGVAMVDRFTGRPEMSKLEYEEKRKKTLSTKLP